MSRVTAGVLRAIPAALVLLACGSASAATFVVTKTADTADGTCNADCSLREAIVAANALAGADVVTVPAGVFALTIPGDDEDAGATGDLDVRGDVEIRGAGAAVTQIVSPPDDGLFEIDPEEIGTNVTLSQLRLSGGSYTLPAIFQHGPGGLFVVDSEIRDHQGIAILLHGQAVFQVSRSLFENNHQEAISINATATIDDTVVRAGTTGALVGIRCSAACAVVGSTIEGFATAGLLSNGDLHVAASAVRANGRGLWNEAGANLVIEDSTIEGSHGAVGVGVFNDGGTVEIVRSRITGNTSPGDGAGLRNRNGTATVVESTFDGNHAQGSGGAIWSANEAQPIAGSLQVRNSTLSGNSAAVGGGGVFVGANNTAALVHVTLVDNVAPTGSAAHFATNGVTIANTLVRGSCTGGFASLGGNLESPGGTCAFGSPDDQPAVLDPMIGPLADNGGPTPTHLLLAGSTAIDEARSDSCLPTDQRGQPRPRGVACDVGALERAATGCASAGAGSAIAGAFFAIAGLLGLRARSPRR